MLKPKLIGIIISLMLLVSGINAQIPPVCVGGSAPVEHCAAACIHCNLDGYGAITNTNHTGGTAPFGYCTFIVHHIEYVGFVAGSSNLSIEVNVPNCVTGTSLELGIYGKDCADLQPVSNCHTAMFPGVYTFTSNEPLCVGCPYYLVIDGNGPSNCNFTVSVIGGTTVAPPVTFNGPIQGPDHVCQGEEADFTVSHNGACYKDWSTIEGGVVGPNNEAEVTVIFNTPGLATLCFKGENLCNPPMEICKTITVHPNPIEVNLGPFEICDDEFYLFDNVPYKEGLHQIDYKTIYGCDSTIFLDIIEIETYRENFRVAVCAPDCYKKSGREYCLPGTYPLTTQSTIAPFCDSMFLITVNIIDIRLELEKSGDLSCGDTIVTISSRNSIVTGNGRRVYTWRNELFDEVGDRDTLTVKEPGRYCLEVIIETPEGEECMKELCIDIIGVTGDPELEIDTVLSFCLNDTLCLDSIPIAEKNGLKGKITFHTGPPNPANQINGKLVVTDSIDLFAWFQAGICEDELMFKVFVLPTPEIMVRDTLRFCEGDTIDLMQITLIEQNPLGNITYHNDLPPSSGNQWTNPAILKVGDKIYVQSSIGQCNDVDEVTLEELPVPDPSYLASKDTICLNDTIDIDFVGDLNTTFNYQWSWSNGSPISQGNEDYKVFWRDTGLHTIMLIVDNGICESVEIKTIYVEAPLEPLILECFQDDTTILFTWSNLIGAKNYIVEIILNNGTSIRLTDTSMIFTGLVNGDIVRIRVTAVGPESCGDLVQEIECKAIFCPPREVAIDSILPICLDPSSVPIALTANIEGGTGGETYIWTGMGITDMNNGTFDPKIAGVGSHLISITHSDNDCDYRGSIVIEVLPRPIGDFIMDSVICIDTSANLTFIGSASSSASGAWSYDGGFAFPVGGAVENKQISWNTPGRKTVELIITDNGCVSIPVLHDVVVEPELELPNVSCEVTPTSVTFRFPPVVNADGYFIDVLTGQVGNRTSDTSIVFSGLVAGEDVEITIRAISGNSCGDVEITIKCTAKECDVLDFDIDSLVRFCANDAPNDYQLTAALPGSQGLGMITWTGPSLINDGGLIDMTQLNIGQHPYVVHYDEEGCFYQDTLWILIVEAPTANAGMDQLLTCMDSIVSIGTLNNNPEHSFTWTGSGVQIIGNGSTAETKVEGQYILTVLNMLTGCIDHDTVLIKIEQDIPASFDLMVQDIGCDSLSDLGSIVVNNVGGGFGPYEYRINNGIYGSQSTFNNLPEGSYDIEVRDANGCVHDTTVTVNNISRITLDLGPDLVVYQGGSVRIEGMTNAPFTQIIWTPQDDLSCDDCINPFASPDSTTTYRATVIDENGCSAWDEVVVRVKMKNIFIPNVISPNGDGINDWLEIFTNDEVEEIELMQIYDRWGEQLFFIENQLPGSEALRWDGSFRGERINPSVLVLHVVARFKDGSTISIAQDLTIFN